MAKRLIEAMHGTISASNLEAGGAQFSISLPMMDK
jgi:signal transduction histidine kinase